MNLFKRMLAGLFFLLGVAGLLVSLAAAVGVWVVKGPVTEKMTGVFARVEAALDAADQGLDQAGASLDRAAERLADVREEQRRVAAEAPRPGMLRRMAARAVQQRVGPEIGDAHEKLHAVAE